MKYLFSLWLSGCLFGVIRGQDCLLACEERTTLTIPSCEAFNELDNFLVISLDCEFTIVDEAGNEVPNPIPADPQYFGQTLTLTITEDGDFCTTTITINFTGTPEIIPVPFNSISASNYNAGRVPRPQVKTCTDKPIELAYFDEFISYCTDVPRVVRTWIVSDSYGNTSTVMQTFDVVADLACTIVAPSRIKAGIGTEVRSVLSPQGFPPFNYQWTLIGQDWSIKENKLDPSKVILTPGPAAGKATLNLDLFDRLGCKTTCIKEFEVIRNSRYGMAANAPDIYALIHQNQLMVQFGDKSVESIRLVDLAGQIRAYQKISQPQTGEISLNISALSTGIYFLQVLDSEELNTIKIYKP